MNKKSSYLKLIVILFLSTCTLINTQAQKKKRFIGARTNEPAKNWTEGMLTGNGRMGAIMYGNPYDETIIFNHNDLYLTLGTKEFVKNLQNEMPEIKRKALLAGKDGPALVHKLMNEKTGKKIAWTDPFHPAFSLSIKKEGNQELVQNYLRSEDFTSGELKVSWKDNDGLWYRKMFISRTNNVAVIEIKGPKGKVNSTFSMHLKHELIKVEKQVKNGELSAHVTYKKGKGGYDNLVKIIPTGGKIETKDGAIRVSNANKIVLLIQVNPWRTPLPKTQSEAWAFSAENPNFKKNDITNKLSSMSTYFNTLPSAYEPLFQTHKKKHNALFSSVNFTLGDTSKYSHKSSQMLLAQAIKTGKTSPELVAQIYDACRYLIICSTNSKPANLQGIWTGTWKPEWSGDYTTDSNLQLEIQSIMSCNMPELMESYFQLIESWVQDCRLNARKLYGCRGIVSNPRASNTPLYLHWGRWPGELAIGTMGWMLHFFYDYYQFTGDAQFLKERVVPLLKESAFFYEDLLKNTDIDNGKYRFFLSYSPEQDHLLYANSTFDISVAKAVLKDLIQSCKLLHIEKNNLPKWQSMLNKMPDYMINEKGELMEWAYKGTTENYNQRHHSHLLPLYQFCEFDKESNPQLWNASKKAFEAKEKFWLKNKKADSNHITHGLMNQGQCAARLGRGDIISYIINKLATQKYIYPNFMMSYWPNYRGFGFDPIGTLPDIINNSLAFAWEEKLNILPALPPKWTKGAIKNILLRGQMQLKELKWDLNKKRIQFSLIAKTTKNIKLYLPEEYKISSITQNGKVIQKNDVSIPIKIQKEKVEKIDITLE